MDLSQTAQPGKEGKIVAPVFAKTYWYNNQTDADSIRAQHVTHVQTLLDDDYMDAVQEIAGYPSVIDAQDFAAACRPFLRALLRRF